MSLPNSLPMLETNRLTLRQIGESDAKGLHAAYGDPEAMRFWDFPASRDLAQTAARIDQAIRGDSRWHGAWAIVPHGASRCVGMICYHHREPWNRRLELGWILAPAYWRRQFMTEAARAVLQHCFTTMETHRIEAMIEPDNSASRRLAAKLGFIEEAGPLRDRICVAGQFRSTLMYALLQPDWVPMAAQSIAR